MKTKRLTWFLLLTLAGACKSKDDTNIVVEVWSDLEIPARLTAIRVEVTGPTTSISETFPLTSASQLPARLALVPRAAKDASLTVRSMGLLVDGEVVGQAAQVAFAPGVSQLLKLVVEEACVHAGCTTSQSCTAGSCTPIPVLPVLPGYDPKTAALAPDASVGAGADSSGLVAGDPDAEAGGGHDAFDVRVPEVAVSDAAAYVDGPSGSGGTGGRTGAPDAGSPDGVDAPAGSGTGGTSGGAGGGPAGATGTGGTGGSSTSLGADCAPPSPLANGTVSAPTTTPGSLASYACGSGFSLVGVDTLTCLANGTWSGAVPTCVPVDCGVLPPPANGAVSAPVTTYNAKALYSCSVAGYKLSGAATRTCQANGTWSDVSPTCVLVDCGAPASPGHGSVNAPVTTYNSTASYQCTTAGYALSGAATRTCQADGQWSEATPTCALVDCGALPAPSNGVVNAPVTTFGATATYACTTTGYALSGAATRTCQASGQWSGTAPSCDVTYGQTCSATTTCLSSATCCDGSDVACDGTKLPAGDATSPAQFVVSADGLSVADTVVGLVWQRDGAGVRTNCSGTDGLTCTWGEARNYCAGLTLGGLTGWRVPGWSELRAIVDFTKVSPALDSTVFPSTPSERFWTSAPSADSTSGAWFVSFADGTANVIGVETYNRVRCVR